MYRREQLARVMLLGLVAWLAGGCASWDRHVFQSTEQRPASVTLIDVEADETLWRFDVPPNHRLTLDLAHRDEVGAMHVSGRPATHMNWKLHRVGLDAMVQRGGQATRRVNGGRIELDDRLVRIHVDYAEPIRRQQADVPDAEAADEADEQPVEAAMAEANAEAGADE